MMRYLLIFFGFTSLTLGIIGILLPVLPTTPFLLLAAVLFLRSSEPLYQRLVSSKILGTRIRKFREEGGMNPREKLYSIMLMWLMISASLLLTGFNCYIIALGALGTLVMGLMIKTVSKEKK